VNSRQKDLVYQTARLNKNKNMYIFTERSSCAGKALRIPTDHITVHDALVEESNSSVVNEV
jgi:hypothetical protein